MDYEKILRTIFQLNDKDIREVSMCNLSEGVEEKGIEKDVFLEMLKESIGKHIRKII